MPSSVWRRAAPERMGSIQMANTSRGSVLGDRIRIAGNAWSRAVGLLGQTSLDSGDGLLIDPSSGIHTFGMRFAIDVIALDGHLRVLGLWEQLGPFHIAGVSWKTRCVLELPIGTIRNSGTRIGDQLEIGDRQLVSSAAMADVAERCSEGCVKGSNYAAEVKSGC
ncbi:MAG: DUF192 domain-containing protein [Candidatus Korobacteraceae bacterium]